MEYPQPPFQVLIVEHRIVDVAHEFGSERARIPRHYGLDGASSTLRVRFGIRAVATPAVRAARDARREALAVELETTRFLTSARRDRGRRWRPGHHGGR